MASSVPSATLVEEAAAGEAVRLGRFAVSLPPLAADGLPAALNDLQSTLGSDIVVFAAEQSAEAHAPPGLTVKWSNASRSSSWALTAADFVAAQTLLEDSQADAMLVMGEPPLSADALRRLVEASAAQADVIVPRYEAAPHEGFVTSSMIYPLTRVLFGLDVHFPLPSSVLLSKRAVTLFASKAQSLVSAGTPDGLIWVVSESAVAGLTVREFDAGLRPTQTPTNDFQDLFVSVIGSLFQDLEAKASFWQRARIVPRSSAATFPAHPGTIAPTEEAVEMMDNFRSAQRDLEDIWRIILTPQSLLSLKHLARSEPGSFQMPHELWAHILFDFILAFRLRTMNRGHLLGALIPLYLAWVASFLAASGQDSQLAVNYVEATAMAIAGEKAHLLSRWRWPDRFNP